MFGIIDNNKKFILLDQDNDKLRASALMLAKETKDGFIPMFDEDTVDKEIKKYKEKDIEIAYNGEKYVKGFAPAIDNEYQSKQREKAYETEVDPITAHIQRLRDDDPESPDIKKLIAERKDKIMEIKTRFPYAE